VRIVVPGSITLNAPLAHLHGENIGPSNSSRGGGAMTIATAGALDLPALAGLCAISGGSLNKGRGGAGAKAEAGTFCSPPVTRVPVHGAS
jgi:hypothetical protein